MYIFKINEQRKFSFFVFFWKIFWSSSLKRLSLPKSIRKTFLSYFLKKCSKIISKSSKWVLRECRKSTLKSSNVLFVKKKVALAFLINHEDASQKKIIAFSHCAKKITKKSHHFFWSKVTIFWSKVTIFWGDFWN